MTMTINPTVMTLAAETADWLLGEHIDRGIALRLDDAPEAIVDAFIVLFGGEELVRSEFM